MKLVKENTRAFLNILSSFIDYISFLLQRYMIRVEFEAKGLPWWISLVWSRRTLPASQANFNEFFAEIFVQPTIEEWVGTG